MVTGMANKDWQAGTLDHVRALILQADPQSVEELKWKKPSKPGGVPVWSHHGIICTGEVYKDKVKLTFAHGAKLHDPDAVFNGNDRGSTRRSIDLKEGSLFNEDAFKTLVQAAVSYNHGKLKKPV
jgi:hypothetical protein